MELLRWRTAPVTKTNIKPAKNIQAIPLALPLLAAKIARKPVIQIRPQFSADILPSFIRICAPKGRNPAMR
jgi:hypothetical protein